MALDREDRYEQGLVAGLERAAQMVMAAPILSHGTRLAAVPGGFPRVADDSVDPDGDPNNVYCNYALRDAVLHWISTAISEVRDGS